MNKIKILTVILIFLSGITFFSCKTKSLSVKILKPADIYVPSHIKNIAVINRSLPEKGNGNQFSNVVEGILSGEGIFADKYASKKTIAGLADGLQNFPRYEVITPEINLTATGGATFPPPLSWQEVEQLCRKYSVDGLILLEVFDSNTSKRYNSKQRTEKKDGKEITYTEFFADLDIEINAGWRIYDPKTTTIVDDNIFTDRKILTGSGRTKKEAESRLPDQIAAIEDAGYFAGRQYAKRISPSWIAESRHYYVKANDDFKKARYKVEANLWEDAAYIWKKYTNNPDPKIAGRACYNMAVASEISGKYKIASDWAQKAYGEYRLKDAKNYIIILQNRIKNEERLKKQINN